MEILPKLGQEVKVEYSHRKKIYFFIGRVLRINYDSGKPLILVSQPAPWGGKTSRWCSLDELRIDPKDIKDEPEKDLDND